MFLMAFGVFIICYYAYVIIANNKVRENLKEVLKHFSVCCSKVTRELEYILRYINNCVSNKSKDIKKLNKVLSDYSFEESQKTLEELYKNLNFYADRIKNSQYISGFWRKNKTEMAKTILSKENADKISNIHCVYEYVRKTTEGK